MPPPDFCKADAAQAKKPFKHIMLEEQPETSLEELVLLHGSTDAGDCARQSQADPHCNICGGGESEMGNEMKPCRRVGVLGDALQRFPLGRRHPVLHVLAHQFGGWIPCFPAEPRKSTKS